MRGGVWDNVSFFLRASDRFRASGVFTGRVRSFGFRAVRSVP